MSDGKIDENITKSLIANGDKEDETLDNSASDGEIFDDDEPEEQKPPTISFPCRKNQKNFRSRQSESEDDGKSDKKKCITDVELKTLKAHIANGDQTLDKSDLESYRKKIIDELGRKDDKNKPNLFRNNSDPPRNHQNTRFSAPNRRDGFRGNIDQNRRFGGNNRGMGNRPTFQDRNRNNNNNRNRENGFARPGPDEVRIIGVMRPVYFPKSIIKHTKAAPSISYAENPNPRQRSNNARSIYGNKMQSKERSVKSDSEKKNKIETPTKEMENKPTSSTKISDEKVIVKAPSKESLASASPVKQPKEEKKDVKAFNEPVEKNSEKSPKKSPSKLNKSSEKIKTQTTAEAETEKSPIKLLEKLKVELKIERKKSPKRIEKPKVNIFLEDSDEVDEFEKAIADVKSKWSSPEKEAPIPQIVPAPFMETRSIPDIPVVIESPERSPMPTPLAESIFNPCSVTIERSPTPSPPPKPASRVKNVCSFLSDIASGNMFSGLGLGSGLYDEDSSVAGLNLDRYKIETEVKLPEERKFGTNIKLDIESIMEPDTTAEKIVEKLKDSDSSSSDSDDSDSDTSSSSDSDSDDTTSESEESSEESSDDDVPSFTRGFGRFDASSMPMVTQIKPTAAPSTMITPTATVVTSRFQPQQSIIKPPGLLSNVTRSALYTTSSVTNLPTVTTPFNIGLGMQFPIPFKIYSLRDTNCSTVFPSSNFPTVSPVVATPIVEKKQSEKASDKDKDRRDRDRKRSRSHSRERDKKRLKDDRRKSPPRKRSQSPAKKRHDERGRQTDERKDLRRRESSPRHGSQSSRASHGQRQSPIRRSRKSRSRTPQRARSPIGRPRTPPPRPRTPPAKIRRSPPTRRSISRSPPAKHRRSSSPGVRRMRSPSPGYRRSPRRRFSRSPIGQSRIRRSPSPNYRYERRSFSPTFHNEMDSPIGYKPDSTISDTELERQQQYMQEEFYLAKWNNPMSGSPKRPNLDDRIHRMLSDSPTQNSNSNVPHGYQPNGYPYPMSHDNQGGMFYPEMYHTNLHQMPPPPVQLQSARFAHSMNHNGPYEEFNNFSSPRNFVNNSNLVEITQNVRDRQRAGSNQVAVQVGNCLEIVPSNKIATSPETPKEPVDKTKPLSPEAVRLRAEKRTQLKLKRKVDRERKRASKHTRKEKLRQEIQRYLDAGVLAEHSDDENLVPLRTVNIAAIAERGIIKKIRSDAKTGKKVLFRDGILPGETTSEDDGAEENENDFLGKQRRIKFRKRRLTQLIKNQTINGALGDSSDKLDDPELENAPPPHAPTDQPPPHLRQPRLKKITTEMFAAFPVNPEPLYYTVQKIQQANGYHQAVPPPRPSDRFNYYKKQPPPVVCQSPGYIQQQRSAISKSSNSVSSLDPRIRSAEKSFA